MANSERVRRLRCENRKLEKCSCTWEAVKQEDSGEFDDRDVALFGLVLYLRQENDWQTRNHDVAGKKTRRATFRIIGSAKCETLV